MECYCQKSYLHIKTNETFALTAPISRLVLYFLLLLFLYGCSAPCHHHQDIYFARSDVCVCVCVCVCILAHKCRTQMQMASGEWWMVNGEWQVAACETNNESCEKQTTLIELFTRFLFYATSRPSCSCELCNCYGNVCDDYLARCTAANFCSSPRKGHYHRPSPGARPKAVAVAYRAPKMANKHSPGT